jgi:hypothetical protein
MDTSIDRVPAQTASPAPDNAEFPSLPELPEAAIRCVGVVGLGRMGKAFAENLLPARYCVVAYDRDKQRAQQVGGARAAECLAERGWVGLDWSVLGLLAAADAGLGDTRLGDTGPASQQTL